MDAEPKPRYRKAKTMLRTPDFLDKQLRQAQTRRRMVWSMAAESISWKKENGAGK